MRRFQVFWTTMRVTLCLFLLGMAFAAHAESSPFEDELSAGIELSVSTKEVPASSTESDSANARIHELNERYMNAIEKAKTGDVKAKKELQDIESAWKELSGPQKMVLKQPIAESGKVAQPSRTAKVVGRFVEKATTLIFIPFFGSQLGSAHGKPLGKSVEESISKKGR